MKKMENKQGNQELQNMNDELRELLNRDSVILDDAHRQTSAGKKKSSSRMTAFFANRSVKRDVSRRKRKEKKKRKKRKRTGLRVLVVILSILLIVLIVAAAGIFIMRQRGKSSLLSHAVTADVAVEVPEDAVISADGTVTWQGGEYVRNEDVISLLLMGVDREDLEGDQQIGENGQTDTLILVALNTSNGKLTFINISRDSMVDVDLYNVENGYAGTETMQLALAYAYGDGKEESCKNTMKSVSRLFYGMPVDGYAAIDLPAINVLNDAIGGVEVDVLEDLTYVDPTMTQGTHLLLQGTQAETYVRSRLVEQEDAPVDANNYRMERQKQYLTNFITKALSETRKDLTLPLSLYRSITPYLVTDISASEVTYLASLALQGEFSSQDMISVPGEVVMGEEYAEFHVDEDALYQMILEIYYNRIS